jgi:hypothetical protein
VKKKECTSYVDLERSPTIVTTDKPVGYKKRKKNKRRTEGIDHYHHHE